MEVVIPPSTKPQMVLLGLFGIMAFALGRISKDVVIEWSRLSDYKPT